jgi:hypothetical protein
MGDSKATMVNVNDSIMAHYMAPPMPGVPSHWNNYLRVDDVDASAAKAERTTCSKRARTCVVGRCRLCSPRSRRCG